MAEFQAKTKTEYVVLACSSEIEIETCSKSTFVLKNNFSRLKIIFLAEKSANFDDPEFLLCHIWRNKRHFLCQHLSGGRFVEGLGLQFLSQLSLISIA